MSVSLHPNKVIKLIKKGVHPPIYFLQGPELFYVDEVVAEVEKIIPLEERKLNLVICYGKETTMQKIVNEVGSVSMLGGKKVVLVKNAHEIEDIQQQKGRSILLNYIEHPYTENFLVLAYKGKALGSNSVLGKKLQKKGYLVSAPKVYERDLDGWIQGYVNSCGYRITPDAAMSLQALVGSRLDLLAKELKKIMISQSESSEITRKVVTHHVGMHKEINNFALQNALCYRDKGKAIEIMSFLSQNSRQYPILPLLSLLTTFFMKVLQLSGCVGDLKAVGAKLKIHPYFMKDYLAAKRCYSVSELVNVIDYLHQADLHVKGIGSGSSSEGAILEELVSKILLG